MFYIPNFVELARYSKKKGAFGSLSIELRIFPNLQLVRDRDI